MLENLEISVERDDNGRKSYVCWINKGSCLQKKYASRNLPNLLDNLKEYLRDEFDRIDEDVE